MKGGPSPAPPAPARQPKPETLPGTVRRWLADRLGLDDLGRALGGGQVPGGASLWHTLGAVAAGLVML